MPGITAVLVCMWKSRGLRQWHRDKQGQSTGSGFTAKAVVHSHIAITDSS